MQPITRRTLLSSVAPGAALIAAGCAGVSVSGQIPATVLAGIQAIGTEITQILPLISTAANIPASTVTEINSIVAQIQQATSVLSTASTASAGTSTLQTIETYINDLAPLVAPFLSLIPGVGSVLGLIIAALPALEAAAGILISLLSPAASAIPAPALPASARLRGTPTTMSQAYLNMLIARANALRAARHLHHVHR